MNDPFDGFDLETRIEERAVRAGLRIGSNAIETIVTHARAVLEHNERLHLTTVVEPGEFLERHIGESLEGAALLDTRVRGRLVDLGSGNGYPAIPIAAIHRRLEVVCVEATETKATFLSDTLAAGLGQGTVWKKQVQRPGDFEDTTPIRVLTSRAMGNWERIFPRIARLLATDGVALLWAGQAVKEIACRESWQRLDLVARHPIPQRANSWIWCFRRGR